MKMYGRVNLAIINGLVFTMENLGVLFAVVRSGQSIQNGVSKSDCICFRLTYRTRSVAGRIRCFISLFLSPFLLYPLLKVMFFLSALSLVKSHVFPFCVFSVFSSFLDFRFISFNPLL